MSLDWQDLVENPAQIAAQIAALEPVQVATPRLFASGIVASGEQSAGVRIFGVDPRQRPTRPTGMAWSPAPISAADDRDGMLIGQTLADKLGLTAGDTINLLVNTSNGDVDEQPFTIRGVYSTRTPGFDESTVLMPLAKAQAITRRR